MDSFSSWLAEWLRASPQQLSVWFLFIRSLLVCSKWTFPNIPANDPQTCLWLLLPFVGSCMIIYGSSTFTAAACCSSGVGESPPQSPLIPTETNFKWQNFERWFFALRQEIMLQLYVPNYHKPHTMRVCMGALTTFFMCVPKPQSTDLSLKLL